MAIRINDNARSFEYGCLTVPKLKGRVHVVLKDIKTGRIDKEFKGENVVTNAVKDILGNPFLGSINMGSVLPLYDKWYGGILGYKEAHTDDTDPTDYFVKGNDIQELTGHAGPTNPSTSQMAEDTQRGRKIAAAFSSDGKTYTQTFEWGSSEGNGIYSAFSLTHKDTGDAGLGNTSSTFAALNPFDSIGNLPNATIAVNVPDDIFIKYDAQHCLWFHIGGENDSYSRGQTSFETDYLTLIIRRLPYDKAGIHDTLFADADFATVHYVHLGFNLYNQPSYYFDYTNKKLWIFSNITGVSGYQSFPYSNTTVNYAIIDCTTGTVDSEGQIVSDDSDLAPTSMEKFANSSFRYDPSRMRNANIIKDGNYVYLPMSDGVNAGAGTAEPSSFNVKGLKKINITNQSEQTAILYNDVQAQFKSAFLCGGLIINSGRVVNGGVGYSCASPLSEAEAIPCYAIHTPNRISSVVTYLGAGGDSGAQARYIMANKLVNTTIYNLKDSQLQPMSFTKTASKLLQVTYSLTEVTS